MARTVGTYLDDKTRASIKAVTDAEQISTSVLVREIIKQWANGTGAPRVAAAKAKGRAWVDRKALRKKARTPLNSVCVK